MLLVVSRRNAAALSHVQWCFRILTMVHQRCQRTDNENENQVCFNKQREKYDALPCYKINYEVRLGFLSSV